MKRIISILFLIIYLNVGFGASVDCHYCAGKLSDLKVCGITVKSSCPMKSMHSNCCKDRVHLCKTDNHKSPPVAIVTTLDTPIKVPVCVINDNDISLATVLKFNINYLPPGNPHSHLDCPLFISNRVFRI